MNIAICDDEIIQHEVIASLINGFDNAITFHISKYKSGEELAASYKDENRFDIIFLDIKMKKLNGIETAKIIRAYDKKVVIVLVTSLIEYAIIGYSVKANEFIMKPVTKKNFDAVFERVMVATHSLEKKVYIIENRKEKIIIDTNDIYYIESNGRKVSVNTKEGTFEQSQTISAEEKRLKNQEFIRTHRAYLVNMNNIHRIKSKEIILKNKETIPLSAKRYKQVYDAFTMFMIGGRNGFRNDS